MLKLRTIRRVLEVIMLLASVWMMVTLMIGCKNPKQTLTIDRWHDRVVSRRDTIVYTPADSATVRLALEMAAWRKWMRELEMGGPRTVRGRNHASLTMAVVHDSLHLEANCDSVAHVLNNALVTITERDSTVALLERETARAKSEKGTIPGWMQGTIWLIVVIVCTLFLLFLLFLLIKKHLLKRA